MATPENPPDSDTAPSPVQAEPPSGHTGLRLGKPKSHAAGLPAVLSSLKHVFGLAGLRRGWKGMARLNQKDGFDCPSCAWPDPSGHRAATEFCENGAKALASETTKRRADAAFFARHSVAELSEQSDYWMEKQGRLVEPLLLEKGATHYRPIAWDEAFALVAEELNALPGSDDAIFYTSGRTVNEAAFLWQLFARMFGTNNLPDCSNMCHESSGAALGASLGVGKGTVSLEDIESADTLLVVGQNPGTNHPRMLSSLQKAVRQGAEIVSVNPLKEAGLVGFAHPQEIAGMMGAATPLANDFLRVKINGDQALFQGLGKALLEREKEAPGTVLDHCFVEAHTHGFAAYRARTETADWKEIEERSGIPRHRIEETAQRLLRRDRRVITCWAMGLTQHRNAVATIREIVNVHLLLGALAKPGAGLCPVRGHSNVQGDRTMGIFEKMPAEFHDRLDRRFGFESPREHGHDTVGAIRAMHGQPGKVFIAMGGNFLQATPDTHYVAEALRNCRLTVQVSTKLNRSHLVTGERALILPCLGRSERHLNSRGERQFSTVENSMSIVHASRGKMEPASEHLLSETMIAARLAAATLGERATVDFPALAEDHDRIRDLIADVVPVMRDYNERVRQPGGFYLGNEVNEKVFRTPSGKAEFSDHSLSSADLEEGQYLLMTLRSHDQFNTTVYGLHDRYRGIGNERRILFMNPGDMESSGIQPLAEVDIACDTGGRRREVSGFLAIPYDIPERAVAGYFPELNAVVPVEETADISGTPCSKSVPVSVEATPPRPPGSSGS